MKNNYDLKLINGHEILEFLNDQLQNNEELCDVSLNAPLEFEIQVIENGKYKLYFTAYFNNWGEYQPIDNNHINIHENGKISFCLGEPFEGDGSDEVLEKLLGNWLQKHTFISNEVLVDEFYKIVWGVSNILCDVKYGEKIKLQEAIDQLIIAKSYGK